MAETPQEQAEILPYRGHTFTSDDYITLYYLTPQQVQSIDRALTKANPFAEIRLVKIRGRLQFMQILESFRFSSVADKV